MTGWRRRAALWAVGAALGAASATAIALSPTVNHGFIAFALIIGGSFIATGLVALARRPENRFGLLLYAVGVAWFVGTLTTSGNAYVFSIGALFSTTYYAVLVHAILAYPRGRLESRPAKVIVAAAYADTLGIQLLVSLVGTSHDISNDADAPRNVLMVSHHPDVASAAQNLSAAVGVVLLAAVVAIVIQRWRSASAAARRVLAPVLVTSGVGIATIAVALLVEIASGDTVGTVAFIISSLAFASIPLGFLVGILRTSLSRSGAVAELIDELSRSHEPGRVRRALRQAVGDPSLELAYWLGDLHVYVDADGRPLDPAERPDRAVTIVERSGKRVAALIHDPALADNTELLETVGGTAGLALENEQLQADLRARLGALEQSERRFRELLENVHLIAVSLDLDGRITFCNQYLADLAGYSRAELIGPPVGRDVQPRRRAVHGPGAGGLDQPARGDVHPDQIRRAARDRVEQHTSARRRRPSDRIDEHRRGRDRAQPRHAPAAAPGAGGAGAGRVALDGRRPPARPRAPDARAHVLAGHILAAGRPTGPRSPSTRSS